MKFRRHLTPSLDGIGAVDRQRATRWGLVGLGAVLAGYLFAYLILFPAPILPGHQVVPRVLGLTLAEAQAQVKKAELVVADGGSEPHPSAAQGTVFWQDPPPGVIARQGLKVTLVVSAGPPKIPVPDVSGLDGPLAQRLVAAAGLTVSQVESVQADAPRGRAMLTRPPAGTALAPGAGLSLVVSRGAPTIPVSVAGSCSDSRYAGVCTRSRLAKEAGMGRDTSRRRMSPWSSRKARISSARAGSIGTPDTVRA